MKLSPKLMRTTISKPAGVVMLAVCIAACSQQNHPAVKQESAVSRSVEVASAVLVSGAVPSLLSGKKHQRELMRAIFEDYYDPESGKALKVIEEDGTDGVYQMTFVSARKLADGRTAVIVNGSPSDEYGTDRAAHVAPGMLNLYFLRRQNSGWIVLERHENVAMMGSEGQIGSVKWITPGLNKQGFIISSGGIWQGYEISVAEVFDLDGGIRHLGSFKEMSNNSGACGPGTGKCWDVGSTIRFVESTPSSAYHDILVGFTGKMYEFPQDGNGDYYERVHAQIKQTARYHFDGKEYVLSSGTNPVPGI